MSSFQYVTSRGCVNMTKCPREIKDIEAVMAGAAWPIKRTPIPFENGESRWFVMLLLLLIIFHAAIFFWVSNHWKEPLHLSLCCKISSKQLVVAHFKFWPIINLYMSADISIKITIQCLFSRRPLNTRPKRTRNIGKEWIKHHRGCGRRQYKYGN